MKGTKKSKGHASDSTIKLPLAHGQGRDDHPKFAETGQAIIAQTFAASIARAPDLRGKQVSLVISDS